MNPSGKLFIRDRGFTVSRAELSYSCDSWSIDVETEGRSFDGELWEPYLYHQGLSLSARHHLEIEGVSTAWQSVRREDGYPHPELGIMYVFGHHPIARAKLSFGALEAERIAITWEGSCDIFWDETYGTGVPFRCECWAPVKNA